MGVTVLRAVLVVAVLTAIYVGLSAYMRWDKRRSLEEEHAAGAAPGLSREDYVAKGLAEYERSWEKKLLYGVFLLPLVVGMILLGIAQLT